MKFLDAGEMIFNPFAPVGQRLDLLRNIVNRLHVNRVDAVFAFVGVHLGKRR